MEGILPSLPWTIARASLKVPYLAHQPCSKSFVYFPQYNEFRWIDDAVNLFHGCETMDSLTAVLQCSLFFRLLSAFLECDIDRDDFANDNFIDCCREPAHKYFRKWRTRLSRLSFVEKRRAQERAQALINFASQSTDLFEEPTNFFEKNENFDRVVLSVRLLVSLLSAISDDTFSNINPRSSGPWAPWVSNLAYKIYHYPDLQFRWLMRDYRPVRDAIREHLGLKKGEDIRRHLHDQPNRFPPFPPGVDRGGRAAERLYRLFVDNGWCPYRALQLCRSYDYLVLNSLASLIHNPTLGEDHGQCVELQRCCAHNLIVDGLDDYPLQHDVEETHDCDMVHVPREEVIEIIQSGGIPLISISLENDLDLQVVQYTPYITYTAISHVWSDGLGNPKSNALPRCQLLRLRKMIFQTYFPEHSPFYDDSTGWSAIRSAMDWTFWREMRARKPCFKIDKKRVYFWMDTLCIPVLVDSQSAEENKVLRLRAIRHITPIFAGAFSTLVLDKGLQAVSVPDPSLLSGDEFAAIILSSRWMQRGWTLEEGFLSSSCFFQIMGKPYEISGALHRLLPEAATHHSPLERAAINARLLMPSILSRQLMDEKMLFSSLLAYRASRLTKLLRVPQFVRTWNSLLERSTTKSYDRPLIITNLLDFKVLDLKSVPHEERLKLLIQNCDELPLSLLYNTGPRMSIQEHPELGWIPRDVAGDHLVGGAALRRTNPKGTDSQVKIFISRSDCDRDSLRVLGTLPGQQIPYDVEVFAVQAQTGRNGDDDQEYFIEIQRLPVEGSDDEAIRRVARQIYGQSQGTCIVIDTACGTRSRRGFAGKGVRCSMDSYKRGKVLKYDAPLIAWTPDQWQYRCGSSQAAIAYFDMEHIGRSKRLLFKYGTRRTFSRYRYLFGFRKKKNVRIANTFRRRVALGQKTRPKANAHSEPFCHVDCDRGLFDSPDPGRSDCRIYCRNNPRCARHP